MTHGRIEELARPRTFHSWITDDLHGITEFRILGSRSIFLHPSYHGTPLAEVSPSTTHSIYVGPHRWSDDPLGNLQDIVTLRRWKNYWPLKPRFPRPLATRFNPYNRQYRVFVFGSSREATRYLEIWKNTGPMHSGSRPVSAFRYNSSHHG
ncbi:hypothetical protein CPB85DRAFT_1030054 [Mucidula mucida]|nr:hypothetical protein CPB85DRAFT_1030054 [Mucidula mucida]